MKPVVDAAKRTELHVDAASSISESWPVGWKSQLKNRELVPKIYDPLPVEIKETPIREVTAAIEGLLETPMFYDEAMLQKAKINPDEKLVTYESARSIFIKTITHSLFKADLKHELRVDERGKAFFWIVPRRPIK